MLAAQMASISQSNREEERHRRTVGMNADSYAGFGIDHNFSEGSHLLFDAPIRRAHTDDLAMKIKSLVSPAHRDDYSNNINTNISPHQYTNHSGGISSSAPTASNEREPSKPKKSHKSKDKKEHKEHREHKRHKESKSSESSHHRPSTSSHETHNPLLELRNHRRSSSDRKPPPSYSHPFNNRMSSEKSSHSHTSDRPADKSSHSTDKSSHSTDKSSHSTDKSSHSTDKSSHSTDKLSHNTDKYSSARTSHRSTSVSSDKSDTSTKSKQSKSSHSKPYSSKHSSNSSSTGSSAQMFGSSLPSHLHKPSATKATTSTQPLQFSTSNGAQKSTESHSKLINNKPTNPFNISKSSPFSKPNGIPKVKHRPSPLITTLSEESKDVEDILRELKPYTKLDKIETPCKTTDTPISFPSVNLLQPVTELPKKLNTEISKSNGHVDDVTDDLALSDSDSDSSSSSSDSSSSSSSDSDSSSSDSSDEEEKTPNTAPSLIPPLDRSPIPVSAAPDSNVAPWLISKTTSDKPSSHEKSQSSLHSNTDTSNKDFPIKRARGRPRKPITDKPYKPTISISKKRQPKKPPGRPPKPKPSPPTASIPFSEDSQASTSQEVKDEDDDADVDVCNSPASAPVVPLPPVCHVRPTRPKVEPISPDDPIPPLVLSKTNTDSTTPSIVIQISLNKINSSRFKPCESSAKTVTTPIKRSPTPVKTTSPPSRKRQLDEPPQSNVKKKKSPADIKSEAKPEITKIKSEPKLPQKCKIDTDSLFTLHIDEYYQKGKMYKSQAYPNPNSQGSSVSRPLCDILKLESALYFLISGHLREERTPREVDGVYKFYKSTIEYIEYMHRELSSSVSYPSEHHNLIQRCNIILSYYIKSFFNYKMWKIQKSRAYKNRDHIEEHIKDASKSVSPHPSTTPAFNQRGNRCSPISPAPSPSPASVSSCMSDGGKLNPSTPPSSVTVPQTVYKDVESYITLSKYLSTAVDMWQTADINKIDPQVCEFFNHLENDLKYSLTLLTDAKPYLHYLKTGLERLKECYEQNISPTSIS